MTKKRELKRLKAQIETSRAERLTLIERLGAAEVERNALQAQLYYLMRPSQEDRVAGRPIWAQFRAQITGIEFGMEDGIHVGWIEGTAEDGSTIRFRMTRPPEIPAQWEITDSTRLRVCVVLEES